MNLYDIRYDLSEAVDWIKKLPLVEVQNIAKIKDDDLIETIVDKLDENILMAAYESYIESCILEIFETDF